MTKDRNKWLNISYNYLNLPSKLTSMVGGFSSDKVEYLYDATGAKLAKKPNSSASSTEYYLGDVVLKGTSFDVEYLLTSEGRVDYSSGGPKYEFHLKDHLGNTRVAYIAGTNGAADAVQEADYYPFGMKIASTLYENNTNKYLYNGKELQDNTLGNINLDLYDYGARFYDAQIARWTVVDNKAEKYYARTPYTYALNNPVRFIDPDGNDGWDKVKGFTAALVDNASGSLIDLRGSFSYNDAADYNSGQDQGDLASIAIGGGEIAGGQSASGTGAGIVSVSLVAELPSGGTSTVGVVAGGVVLTAGEALTAHGILMAGSGTANLTNQKGRVEEKKSNVSSGNKNSQHTNQKAKETAQEKYQKTKTDYESLKSKANKTPEDKKQLDKLKTEMDHQKKKADETGENHSRNAKGTR